MANKTTNELQLNMETMETLATVIATAVSNAIGEKLDKMVVNGKSTTTKANKPYVWDKFTLREFKGFPACQFKGRTFNVESESYTKVAQYGFANGEFGKTEILPNGKGGFIYIPYKKDSASHDDEKLFVFTTTAQRDKFMTDAKAYGEWYHENVKGKTTEKVEENPVDDFFKK